MLCQLRCIRKGDDAQHELVYPAEDRPVSNGLNLPVHLKVVDAKANRSRYQGQWQRLGVFGQLQQ